MLEASKNTLEQRGTNKSSGQSVGVGFAGGSQNGFTIELGRGMGGLLANGVTASAMPVIGEKIAGLGLPESVKQALGATTAAALGGLAGGSAGASAAFSTDINNRQLHPRERELARKLAKKAQEQGLAISPEEIEEQMRPMGNASFGVDPDSVSAIAQSATQELLGSFQADPTMPRAVSGNFIVEVPGIPRQDIQNFITQNTKNDSLSNWISGSSPYVPSAQTQTNTTSVPPNNVGASRCAIQDVACRSGVGVSQNPPLSPEQRKKLENTSGRRVLIINEPQQLRQQLDKRKWPFPLRLPPGLLPHLSNPFAPSAGKVVVDSLIDEAMKRFSETAKIPLPLVVEVTERYIKPRAEAARNGIDGLFGRFK